MPPSFKLLSILIPIHNEARTLRRIIAAIVAAPLPLPFELICVDDASTDNTATLLAELAGADPRIRVVRHEVNRGKGAAIRTAMACARGEIVLVQDADLEYAPEEYPRLLAPILGRETNVVYGSRYVAPGNDLPLTHFKIGVLILNATANLLYGLRLTDEATCYKVFRADLLKSLPLRCERFEFCPEVTARVALRGERIVEVPISYHYRTRAQGKKIGLRDAFEGFFTLLRYRISG